MSLLVCLNFTSIIDKMVIPLIYQQNRFMQPPPPPARPRTAVCAWQDEESAIAIPHCRSIPLPVTR